MEILNDNTCAWINDLPQRKNIKSVNKKARLIYERIRAKSEI